MARGASGRIVIEIDPELKSDLYDALSGRPLREWFMEAAKEKIELEKQPQLFTQRDISSTVTKDLADQEKY